MKSIRSIALFLLLSLLLSGLALADTDAKGCKDHPLFNRMSGFSIFECKKSFDQLVIKVDNNPKSDKNLKPEGDRTNIKYIFKKSADMPNPPSDLQVMRNYQNAAKQKGGQILVDRPGYTALKFMRDGGAVYAVIATGSGGYRLYVDVLEEKAMTQEITANLMWEKLQKEGFISLQINFDTNKATIKPESMPLVKQIIDLMKNQPKLKVSIEGHTDNQGTAAANKTLSLNRARSVAAAVAAGGIKADRMETVGWGQEKPVADNRTEEGRAVNRRVELVKK
ncbi:MAG: OmpA/MotB domain protein [Deltaproteobacteria bacterium]|nr:OmpA/MotB domain protein [Deltaproteobacteria bacterium]